MDNPGKPKIPVKTQCTKISDKQVVHIFNSSPHMFFGKIKVVYTNQL